MEQGSWRLLEGCDDPELKLLASKLPSTILHSRAGSTVQKYLRAYRRWKTWAVARKLNPIPAKPHEFVLYLQYLGDETSSKATVEEACNSVAWIHTTTGLAPISAHSFVKATLEGLQRTLAKPIVKKEPMTVEILEAIIRDAEKSTRLTDLRLATACLLGFSGFLHFDELINLKPCDIVIKAEMMTIKITRSKTDQLQLGNSVVVVVRSGSITCPVTMLERYLARIATAADDKRFLFRSIQSTKNGESLRNSGKISYSCLAELFKKKLKSLDFPANLFGLHSLRAWGATTAANAGVPDQLFKRHGRWHSENAKDGYVKDNLEARLTVSKTLGLHPLKLSTWLHSL